jgi:hypothetical protein
MPGCPRIPTVIFRASAERDAVLSRRFTGDGAARPCPWRHVGGQRASLWLNRYKIIADGLPLVERPCLAQWLHNATTPVHVTCPGVR